jgi:hypothetical protein
MSIKLHIPDSLSAITKRKLSYEVQGKTVGECLNDLVGLVPGIKKALFYETGGLLPDIKVLVGYKSEGTDLEGLAKKVNDGDEIFVKTNFR